MKTRVTEIFGIQYPIIQGGLAYLGYAELAAAVSNAGGLGQITAATLRTPENLRNEIRKVRKLTDKPFGVNFAIAKYNGEYEELLEVAIEEKVPAISITGGNPQPVLERLKEKTLKHSFLYQVLDTHKKLNNLELMLLWLLDKKVAAI